MKQSLYTELLHVIFIADNAVEEPRVHAVFIHIYIEVENSQPVSCRKGKNIFGQVFFTLTGYIILS